MNNLISVATSSFVQTTGLNFDGSNGIVLWTQNNIINLFTGGTYALIYDYKYQIPFVMVLGVILYFVLKSVNKFF